MTKKLMMLTAGALTALAFAALPALASAGEFVADCSAGATCAGTISGGLHTLEDDSGSAASKFICSSITGTFSQTTNSSTGTAQITLNGCKDELFQFSCNSSGQSSGTIATNTLTTHLAYIDKEVGKAPLVGVLFTGVNMTFFCFGAKTLTGNFIAQLENPECGIARTHHTMILENGATAGTQRYTQVTTTGTVFNLFLDNSHSGSSGTTAFGPRFTLHTTYTEGKTVRLTC